MMSNHQAFALETLRRHLKIDDGALIQFAQQFAVDDCAFCDRGKDLFTLDKLQGAEIDALIDALRTIEQLPIFAVVLHALAVFVGAR